MNVCLIDCYGFFYRTHFALQHNQLRNKDGTPTSVIYLFLNFLQDIIVKHQPKQLICILDAKGKTFRHNLYADYKANRPPMPDELAQQITHTEELITLLGLPIVKKSGYEADDLIAHYTQAARKANKSVHIFSSDKDLLQLIAPNVHVVKTGKRNDPWELVGPSEVEAKYHVPAHQLANYFALVGDSSDNVPGVRGIGPVMAAKLIQKYQDLDNLYHSLEEVPPAARKKLAAERDHAFLSRKLIALNDMTLNNVPNLDQLQPQPIKSTALLEKFKYYNFKSLIEKWNLPALLQAQTQPNVIATLRHTPAPASAQNKISSLLAENTFPFTKHFKRCELTTPAEVEKCIHHIHKQRTIVFDLETTSLLPFDAQVVSIAIVCEEISYFMLCQRTRPTHSPQPQFMADSPTLPNGTLALAQFKAVLEDPTIKKIGHNLKFEYEILKWQNITLAGIEHDTLLYEYLIDADRNRLKLEDVFNHYTQTYKSDFKSLFKDKTRTSITDVPLAEFRTYAMEDTEATALIYRYQLAEKPLDKKSLALYKDIELPLVTVLGEIELSGVCIDEAFFEKLDKSVSKSLLAWQNKIIDFAGEPFNINSTKQLQYILFDKLAIPSGKKTKTGFSTDITVLTELKDKHPIIEPLLQYRKEAKLLNTYIKALPKLIQAQTGRIHTHYHQAVVGTGRLSSQNPNLQNIPIGKESFGIRKGFIAPKGYQIISLDYSQIELRVLAYLSEDPTLLHAYLNHEDIHAYTASLIFEKASAAVTKEERAIGKTVNFSIIYGVSAFTLANRFNISHNEAKTFMKTYLNNYPKVAAYKEQILAAARKNLYVETYYGRKRYVRDINAKDKLTSLRSERIAFNAVIQGTAADMMKLAMIEVHNQCQKGKLHSELVMQVHDELVFYTPDQHVAAETHHLSNILKNIEPFTKLLEVEAQTGPCWEK